VIFTILPVKKAIRRAEQRQYLVVGGRHKLLVYNKIQVGPSSPARKLLYGAEEAARAPRELEQ
jgi:hypothetical protein